MKEDFEFDSNKTVNKNEQEIDQWERNEKVRL